MAFDMDSLLRQYSGGNAAGGDVDGHFDQVAQNAPPEMLSRGLADAFRSESTPPFGQMVGQMFGGANPNQRAGMLTSLIASLAPSVLSSLASRSGGSSGLGGLLGRVLQGGGSATPSVTPEQASKITPQEVQEVAQHAEQHNPGVVDQMGGFYAQHPDLVKGLGAAALAVVLGRMANRG